MEGGVLMLKYITALIKEEDGLGTVEIIVIISVLLAIALIFRNTIISFVKSILANVLPSDTESKNLQPKTDDSAPLRP